jgi:hypothetical protein
MNLGFDMDSIVTMINALDEPETDGSVTPKEMKKESDVMINNLQSILRKLDSASNADSDAKGINYLEFEEFNDKVEQVKFDFKRVMNLLQDIVECDDELDVSSKEMESSFKNAKDEVRDLLMNVSSLSGSYSRHGSSASSINYEDEGKTDRRSSYEYKDYKDDRPGK